MPQHPVLRVRSHTHVHPARHRHRNPDRLCNDTFADTHVQCHPHADQPNRDADRDLRPDRDAVLQQRLSAVPNDPRRLLRGGVWFVYPESGQLPAGPDRFLWAGRLLPVCHADAKRNRHADGNTHADRADADGDTHGDRTNSDTDADRDLRADRHTLLQRRLSTLPDDPRRLLRGGVRAVHPKSSRLPVRLGCHLRAVRLLLLRHAVAKRNRHANGYADRADADGDTYGDRTNRDTDADRDLRTDRDAVLQQRLPAVPNDPRRLLRGGVRFVYPESDQLPAGPDRFLWAGRLLPVRHADTKSDGDPHVCRADTHLLPGSLRLVSERLLPVRDADAEYDAATERHPMRAVHGDSHPDTHAGVVKAEG